MSKNETSEERTAAASYVLNFYNDVASLTHHYANYENLMVEMEEKHKGAEDKLTPEEKDALREFCQMLRYHARVAYIHYISIMQGLNLKPSKEVAELFDKIRNQYVIKRVDIESFVIVMNRALVEKVIKNLLESSHEIVAQLYGEDGKQ